jgi:hypothetical protein
MILETVADVHRFEEENVLGELILHSVPLDEGVHPAQTSPSLLFIRNSYTGNSYVLPVEHPDAKAEGGAESLMYQFLGRGNRNWVFDKKSFIQHFAEWPGLLDINLAGFLTKNKILDATEFETIAHVMCRRFSRNMKQMSKVIPLVKHLEAFDDLADSATKLIKNAEVDEPFRKVNNVIMDTLSDVESNGIFVDGDEFSKHFDVVPDCLSRVYSQYNVYTSTGRPSNRFGGINYAALNHENGCRRSFVSRFGDLGRMVVIDYSAFHPRIICMLTGYKVPVETDIYAYLSKLYFQKPFADDEDIAEAKKLTFRQLYGGVEPKYQHIRYLASLKSFIDNQWEFFQKNNFVETPIFKRKITDKHIQEPSPTKLFNYILQAVEGEISISCLQRVNQYLKAKQTKAVLYTYDAVLYDFHAQDGKETLEEIQRLMSMNGLFPMKTYMGKSYQEMELLTR